MSLWEEKSFNDREKIFALLCDFNPHAAEKTDEIIEAKKSNVMIPSRPI